jgi:4-hydroxybenzoyl-CoA thioesterase/acyl-CoA thioester hydrolase
MTLPLHYRRTVQFAETDMAGVMHFSNYFRLMEEAEHALWRSLGLSVHMSAADGGPAISFPRVEVSCEYSAPVRFEDVLDLSVAVPRAGGKVVAFEVTFSRDNVEVARGRMTTVCCATEHGRFRAVPIPPHIVDKLRAAGAPVSDAPQEGS